MADYQTTVTLAAPPTGNVLLPNGSTVVTIGLDIGAQAAVAALMGGYATQAQLSTYAPKASPAFTGTPTVSGLPILKGGDIIQRVEEFGTTGTADDAAVIQAGIDSLSAAGGGTLLFGSRRTYLSSGLVLKQGVQLRGWAANRQYRGAQNAYACRIKATAGSTGWMIDTPTALTRAIGISGLLIEGVQFGYTQALGGIRLRNTSEVHIENVRVFVVSDSALYQDTGGVTYLTDCFFQSDFSGRTLTDVTGALDIGGFDHYLHGVQANGGSNTAITYPGTLYRAGINWRASTSWIYGVNGEYGDVGWNVSGDYNRFIGARGDFNGGHGFYVPGTRNIFSGVHVIANGFAADNTYDGMQLTGSSNQVIGLIGGTGGRTTNRQRYYYNDQFTAGALQASWAPNTASGVGGRPDEVGTDVTNQAQKIKAVWPPGAGDPKYRPPSRYSTGNTWFDTLNNQPTYSDGSKWRDGSGAVVGNVLLPNQSVMRDDATGWSSPGANCTVAQVAADATFGCTSAMQATVNATGATSQFMQVLPTGARPAVTAGVTYQFLAYTLAMTTTATVSFAVRWWDASSTAIGSTVTTAGASNVVGSATKYAPTPLVAPAGAVSVQFFITFARAGIALGEQHVFSKAHIVPVGAGGAPSDYVAS